MKARKLAPSRTEILITGFGGQGIVLAGNIMGKAASLGDHRESTLTQSYGPEARGGACSAQVIISNGSIHYPYVRQPDILVCMSQGGYDKYIEMLAPAGVLIFDQDLVQPRGTVREVVYAVPATRFAEELGRKMMANIIMVGFVTAITAAVSTAAARDAITGSVPKGTEKMNLAAFEKGYDYGQALLKSRQKQAAGRKGALS
jgi:2-oxoglutarate ferredoxin oxidoreductase subunit gamma